VAEGLTRDDGVPINATERIEQLTEWLNTNPLPQGVRWAWTGDQEDQAESGAFLAKAFAGALGLMFIILLAQFNSVYNSVLVLLAVVLSTTGVLVGMMVMGQTFSIIMTGTGIVALAGIVVNNNIILIDTYQEFSRYMPRREAITRTAEQRLHFFRQVPDFEKMLVNDGIQQGKEQIIGTSCTYAACFVHNPLTDAGKDIVIHFLKNQDRMLLKHNGHMFIHNVFLRIDVDHFKDAKNVILILIYLGPLLRIYGIFQDQCAQPKTLAQILYKGFIVNTNDIDP
jgi:hypothetical protein